MSEYSGKSVRKLTNAAVRALRTSHFDEAVEITDAIISRDEDNTTAHAVQFSSLFKSKRFEQARRMGTRAAELNPKSVFILNNQACLQLEAKQPAAAAGLLRSLIDQYGERGQWLYNLALAQRMVGNFENAIKVFRRTLDFQPDHDRAAFQLADCLLLTGDVDGAVRALDYVRLLRSKHAPSHAHFIHHATGTGALNHRGLNQEFDLWGERFIPKGNSYPITAIKNPAALNLGFIIGAIARHWLEQSVIPVINTMAGSGHKVTVYWHDEGSIETLLDESVTLVAAATLSDADFARRGRDDGLEVLIDVCGMRRGTRQRALGLQLAPVEFGWLAHEGRYATKSVRIVDSLLGEQRFYVAPAAGAKDTLTDNTFLGIGCKQGVSGQVAKIWAHILHQCSDWKLQLDHASDLVAKHLQQQFAALGIDQSRLVFNPSIQPQPGSIVLDNFLNNDPILAAQTCIQGGILLTTPGEHFPAQQSSDLLKQLGKEDWVCSSIPDYTRKAIQLARAEIQITPLTSEEIDRSKIHDLDSFCANLREQITA